MKEYFNRIKDILKDSPVRYFLLFSLLLLILLKLARFNLFYILMAAFFASFILQTLFLKKKSFILYLFRVLMIVLIVFEFVFGKLYDDRTPQNRTFTGDHNVEHPVLGYHSKPNANSELTTRLVDGDTVYSVRYSFDDFGRRIADGEQPADSLARSRHAIFLGCSFTFGEGLDYESSFPAIFEKMNPSYRAYNYGLHGWGPHQSALLFEEGINTLNNEAIVEDSGFCMYTYIDDHLSRVWGGNHYLLYGFESPDVYVQNGQLDIRKRSKKQLRRIWIYNNSETLKYFNIFKTHPKRESFYRRFAGIVNFMASKYYSKWPNGQFYVCLYPNNYSDTAWVSFLDPSIQVLRPDGPDDYSSNPVYRNNYDHHPTPELNTVFTQEISKSITNN